MNDIRSLIPTSPQFPASTRKPEKRPAHRPRTFADYMPPESRGYQTIPNADMLNQLVERALEALKHGVFWDRGSIINIRA